MAAGGTPSFVNIGPGRLYVAPIGTTEPTSASGSLDAAFRVVGYTEDGNLFSSEITTEPVEVAEEIDPIRFVNTRRISSVQFSMAETTRANLFLAMNEGAAATNSAVAYEPASDLSTLVRVMIVWQSEDTPAATTVRWLFRQCFQTGAVELPHRKAPDKALIPVQFNLEKPDSAAVFKVFPNSTGDIA